MNEFEGASPGQSDTTALTRGERKKLRREEKQHQQERLAVTQRRKRLMKKVILGLVLLAFLGGVGWLVSTVVQPNPDLISRRGIHWHVNLAVSLKGEPVEIPANIGLGAVAHANMHTHKVNDQIHVETPGAVRKDAIRLGKFFEIWGKQFNSRCVVDTCSDAEGHVQMFVNGTKNTEFQNYLVQDKDAIEIRHEE